MRRAARKRHRQRDELEVSWLRGALLGPPQLQQFVDVVTNAPSISAWLMGGGCIWGGLIHLCATPLTATDAVQTWCVPVRLSIHTG